MEIIISDITHLSLSLPFRWAAPPLMTPPPTSVRWLSSYQRPSRPWGRSLTACRSVHRACWEWRGGWEEWGRQRLRLCWRSTHCSSCRPSAGGSTHSTRLLLLFITSSSSPPPADGQGLQTTLNSSSSSSFYFLFILFFITSSSSSPPPAPLHHRLGIWSHFVLDSGRFCSPVLTSDTSSLWTEFLEASELFIEVVF